MNSTSGFIKPDSLRSLAGILAVFVVALAIRLAHFENEPITDELYHLLAAQSWADDGTFAIADGEYRRAEGFTVLVAIVGAASDWSVDGIRIFCVVIGALLVAAIYAWTRINVGAAEALVAALLFGILPTAIFLAQYIRFYTLHALLFFLLAWCVWMATRPGTHRSRTGAAVAILPVALFALHLQVTTLVGLAALVLWALLARHDYLAGLVPRTAHRVAMAGGMIVVAAIAAWLGHDWFFELLATYRESALWNSSDNALYYHNEYRDDFGVLWSLAPAAAIVALVSRPMPAFFCVCIFTVAFIMQSFGGMRSERFMFYALPFLAILWGIAAVAVGRRFHAMIAAALEMSGFAGRRGRLAAMLPGALVTGVATFALLTVPAVETAARMTFGIRTKPPEYWDRYRSNWANVAPHLRSIAEDAGTLIATQPLHAIWYLGDVDFAMNATSLADVAPPGRHAMTDPRTGRVVFDNLDVLRSIVECDATGLVIVHGPALHNESRVGDGIADYVTSEMTEVPLPVRTDMRVFRWRTPTPRGQCTFG